ncbi:MAG: hypothetical protein PHC55_12190 [Bacteroidales bacterium]|nr:hypothetical protein [Bacteroidales bacterium]
MATDRLLYDDQRLSSENNFLNLSNLGTMTNWQYPCAGLVL